MLVSSGAMGLGAKKLDIHDDHEIYDGILDFKAAITALGQVELMKTYEQVFEKYHQKVGQILITQQGLEDPKRSSRLKTTVEKLFELGVIPIFNENDTICPDEIEFGDNDILSANIAKLIGAERLIMLTDTDGLYDSDPHKNPDAKLISSVNKITSEIANLAGESSNHMSTGGMKSKVMAAEICLEAGITANILNKAKVSEVLESLSKKESLTGTEFKS